MIGICVTDDDKVTMFNYHYRFDGPSEEVTTIEKETIRECIAKLNTIRTEKPKLVRALEEEKKWLECLTNQFNRTKKLQVDLYKTKDKQYINLMIQRDKVDKLTKEINNL